MNPFDIIELYYKKGSPLYNLLVRHSTDVANKAVNIVDKHPELAADKRFVQEAAMLHDIGIYLTDAPEIGCYGNLPYLAHGYLGHDLLLRHNMPKHARVCERHTGTGISLEEILTQKLPLPPRDMRPVSIEEQIVCFADCFFSKSKPEKEKTPALLRKKLKSFGEGQAQQFDSWCEMFL